MEDESGSDDRREIDQKRFRFDASINIAHILATVGMVVALFSWGGEVNSTQAVLVSENKNMKAELDRTRSEMLMALIEINHKLDNIGRGP